MFRVLDARVGQATSGREIFAFVPRSLYFTLRELTSPAYAHRFYVDGPVIEGDVFTPPTHPTPNAWKTIAIGTTGAGAAGMFAIDVTSPQSGFTAAQYAVGHRSVRTYRPGGRQRSGQCAAAGHCG